MYEIIFKKSAIKELRKVPSHDRQRIINNIHTLAADPHDKSLDVKKLTNESGFRMRVGDWRVKYDREDILKIISITKVGHRREVYR